jgi:AcrR family transcriptional regulator
MSRPTGRTIDSQLTTAATQVRVSSRNGTDQAHAKRAEIVRLAAELFDRDGYHGTSMDHIAGAAGIRKPTLYHYFKSKDEILFWIHEDVIDLITDRHLGRIRLAMGCRQELLEMIGDILELMETRPGQSRTFFEHLHELLPEQQRVVRARRQQYQELVEDVLNRGIAAGEFRQVDVRLAGLTILGACNWGYQWFRPGVARSRDVAYAMCDLLVGGLSPR